MTGESGAMIRTAILAAVLLGAAAPAAGAERSYSVTNFDRIRVDGPFRVRLTTGVAPFARASGAAAALDGIALDVQGRTLVVRSSRSSWGGYPGEAAGPVEIAVGTHDLSAAFLNGAGSLAIDRIKGLSFDLAVQGSGQADVGLATVDQLEIGISGAGSVRVAGTAPKLTAIVRGTSTLDAPGLIAKNATVGAEGPSVVRLTATGEVEVDARGLASVELSGGPACTVKAQGSATVLGCGTSRGR
jgi:hypothetical protein